MSSAFIRELKLSIGEKNMMSLNRLNRMGAKYYLTEVDNNTTLIRTGLKQIVVNQPIQSLNQGWYYWVSGGRFIQDAFPFLSDDEREFLLTGITKKEWDEIFSGNEDGEE